MTANLRSCALPASVLIPLALGAPKPTSIPGEGGLFIALPVAQAPAKEPPREWIDPDTGHRVLRLSDEPGSASLYFHQNAYTPDGEKLIITTPTGLSTINLKTRAIEKVVEGRVNVIITGKRTGNVYYVKNRVVYATDLNTKATREIAKLPPGASVSTVNADETLLAGTIDELNAKAIAEGRAPGTSGASAPSGDPA